MTLTQHETLAMHRTNIMRDRGIVNRAAEIPGRYVPKQGLLAKLHAKIGPNAARIVGVVGPVDINGRKA